MLIPHATPRPHNVARWTLHWGEGNTRSSVSRYDEAQDAARYVLDRYGYAMEVEITADGYAPTVIERPLDQ